MKRAALALILALGVTHGPLAIAQSRADDKPSSSSATAKDGKKQSPSGKSTKAAKTTAKKKPAKKQKGTSK